MNAPEPLAVVVMFWAPLNVNVAPLPPAAGLIVPERLNPTVLKVLLPCPWLPFELVELTWK